MVYSMDLLVRGGCEFKFHQNCSEVSYGSVSQTRGCEFKSHQNCNENLYGSVSQIRGCEFEFYQNSNENSLWIC